MGAGMNGETGHHNSVLPERPPEAERGQTTTRFAGAWSGRHPAPRSKSPRRGRRDTSTERDLAKVREAHWKALATAAALERGDRKAELVCHPRPARCLCPLSGLWLPKKKIPGTKQEVLQGLPEESPAPFFQDSPPQWDPGSEEDEEAKLPLLDFDLELPPELGPEVNHFLQEPTGSSEEEDRNRSSPEPLVEDYERWMAWLAWVHDTPGWWPELAKVPGVDIHQELVWKVQRLLWASPVD